MGRIVVCFTKKREKDNFSFNVTEKGKITLTGTIIDAENLIKKSLTEE